MKRMAYLLVITVLHWPIQAVANEFLDAVRKNSLKDLYELINAATNENIALYPRSDPRPVTPWTALPVATSNEIVESNLIETVNFNFSRMETVRVPFLIEILNTVDENDDLPLHLAAQFKSSSDYEIAKNKAIVKLLLLCGADPRFVWNGKGAWSTAVIFMNWDIADFIYKFLDHLATCEHAYNEEVKHNF